MGLELTFEGDAVEHGIGIGLSLMRRLETTKSVRPNIRTLYDRKFVDIEAPACTSVNAIRWCSIVGSFLSR